MRYIGWLIALLLAAAGTAAYFFIYAPLEKGYRKQEDEIKMWTSKVAALEGHLPDTFVLHPDTLLSNPDTTPVKVDAKLIASIPADDIFSVSSAELTSNGKAEIDKLLPLLRTSAGEVVIMAHWDNVRVSSDKFPSNWELTSAHAASVARYMLAQGVDSKRLLPCGLSAARPLSDNSTPEGRKKNRRLEIYLK